MSASPRHSLAGEQRQQEREDIRPGEDRVPASSPTIYCERAASRLPMRMSDSSRHSSAFPRQDIARVMQLA